ncbi:HdeD family acid-resistance protein [Gordonia sp. NPDC003424]
MTFGDYARQMPNEVIGAVRSMMIATAVTGIVLGVVALVWPEATMLVIAILFGISLIIAGLFRIYEAFAANLLPGGWRVLIGLAGVIVLVAGIIALFNPSKSLVLLAVFIGIAWIFQGIGDLARAFSGSAHAPRWLLILSGIIAIVAGIVMIAFSSLALATLIWVAAIMLIIVSIVTLFTLPKKVDTTVV